MRKNKPVAIIVDIDGVLADSVKDEYKLDFLRGDFTKFEAEIPTFDTFEVMVDIVKALKSKYKLVFVTARNEAYRIPTCDWLERHLCITAEDYDIHMRKITDKRPDTQVKAEVLPKILKKYEVLAAFDDKADNAKLFSYYGIISHHII